MRRHHPSNLALAPPRTVGGEFRKILISSKAHSASREVADHLDLTFTRPLSQILLKRCLSRETRLSYYCCNHFN